MACGRGNAVVNSWLVFATTVTGVILIPALVLLWRFAVRTTRVDTTLAELMTQIREDRAATDKRLRWLEETLWNSRGGNRGGYRP